MTEQGVQVKITEKADALPGESVRAVGMCFYKPVMDLVPGNSYRLCRNPQNPRDASCIEVKDRTRVRAVLNRDVARLLAQYLDTNIVEEPTWLVSFGRVSLVVSATRYHLWCNSISLFPGPSRRLEPVIKCSPFLSFFQRYIVRDISLT